VVCGAVADEHRLHGALVVEPRELLEFAEPVPAVYVPSATRSDTRPSTTALVSGTTFIATFGAADG
jgi:hypothetical protein